MAKAVLSLILFLAPHVGSTKAGRYAGMIAWAAEEYKVPAHIIVVIIHNETGGTWRTRVKSRTNDYGLMQLHVSRTTHRRFLGREHLLYKPALNIRLGTRFLGRVKAWHDEHCGMRSAHPWWAHYNWGFRVLKNRRYVRHVERLLRQIEKHLGVPNV